MSTEIVVLRLIHVLGGVFWVGTALFTTFFLVPALKSVGPAAGQVFAGFQRRKLYIALPIVALLTIASGIRLMMIVSGGSPGYFASTTGRTFSTAGLVAIIAFLFSLFVVRPAAVRAGQLSAALASAGDAERAGIVAELERVSRRNAVATAITTLMLLLTAAGMAVARYLG